MVFNALVGSAAALSPEDEVFAQYREVGVLLWRGFTVQQVTCPFNRVYCFALSVLENSTIRATTR
jgi:Dehydrogenase E1 component